MCCEPIPRQDFWQGADPWGHIFELDPQEQRVLTSQIISHNGSEYNGLHKRLRADLRDALEGTFGANAAAR